MLRRARVLGMTVAVVYAISLCSCAGQQAEDRAAPSDPPQTSTRGEEEPIATEQIPRFWPPPKASAQINLRREWIVPRESEATLKEVAQKLEQAFDSAGYVERSYYSVPQGFALISRLEQIRRDGTPKEESERWSVKTPTRKIFSLRDYVKALFGAQQGYYRIIAFVVTSEVVVTSGETPGAEEAKLWAGSGADRLPGQIGSLLYSDKHQTTALIYEFERKSGGEDAIVKLPSEIGAKTHLERSKLWQALQG